MKGVGILSINTPQFPEPIFNISIVGVLVNGFNYCLELDDIYHVFDHFDTEAILVYAHYVHLLSEFERTHHHSRFLLIHSACKIHSR